MVDPAGGRVARVRDTANVKLATVTLCAMRRGILCAVAALALAAPAALADGDPASDYLIANDAYYPYSPHASNVLVTRLNSALARVRKQGHPLKVALIETPGDLGAYPELFGKPQNYAKLLASEISYGKRHPRLLVVMPQGFGGIRLPKGWKAKLASVKIDRNAKSDGLVRAALAAVPKLT
jgi:hypothetical protein